MPRNNRRRSGSGGRSRSGGGRAGRGRRDGSDGSVPPPEVDGVARGWLRTETFRGATWVVRPVRSSPAVKVYRCPGCDQQIPAGVPHVVVWPFEAPIGLGEGIGDRRHWHTPCWAARDRRSGRGVR